MTIPVASYQTGTTPIQYLEEFSNNKKSNILDNSNIDVPDFDIPDISNNSNVNIPNNIEIPEDLNFDPIDDAFNDTEILNFSPIDDTKVLNFSPIDDKSDETDVSIPIQSPDLEILPQNQISPIKSQYNIIDLFWLLNPDSKQTNNEKRIIADFINIGYNLDFGNLKITLYKITPESIQNNVVFLQSMKLLVSGTIYPASAFKILNVNQDIKFTCIEQLIQNTGEEWQKHRPIVQLEKTIDKIILSISNNNQSYYYEFSDWQLKAFQSALELTYSRGLNMRANLLQKKE